MWWVVENPALGFSVGSVRELSIAAMCSAALPGRCDLKFLLRIRNRIALANLTGLLCHRPAENGGALFKSVPAGDKTFSKVQPGANLSERPPHSTVSESVDSSCCWIPAPRQRASNAAWTSKPAVLDDRLSTAQGKLASP